MRAAVYHGAGDVRVEQVDDPGVAPPGWVRLRVRHAAICGSDASEFRSGPHGIPLTVPNPANGHVGPTIIGHEFVGTVVEAGDGVDPDLVGRDVATGAGVWCGDCRYCAAGRPNLCLDYYTLGIQEHGGLADEALVPARTCVVLPDGLSTETAAMAQPLAVALHALSRAHAAPGVTLAVFGAGGIGALAVAGARARGIDTVVAVDTDPQRLESARLLGASHVLRADDPDLVHRIRAATGGDGADVVLEASGKQPALDAALASAGRGGRIVAVGIHAQPPTLDLRSLTHRELELVGTVAHVCDTDMREAVDLLARHPPLRDLARRVIALEDLVADGLEPLVAGTVGAKTIVAIDGVAR
jgi:(R,R)-butanediol dehydrogenase/meso-butanediol dehydrogenase/diacetyl reductase